MPPLSPKCEQRSSLVNYDTGNVREQHVARWKCAVGWVGGNCSSRSDTHSGCCKSAADCFPHTQILSSLSPCKSVWSPLDSRALIADSRDVRHAGITDFSTAATPRRQFFTQSFYISSLRNITTRVWERIQKQIVGGEIHVPHPLSVNFPMHTLAEKDVFWFPSFWLSAFVSVSAGSVCLLSFGGGNCDTSALKRLTCGRFFLAACARDDLLLDALPYFFSLQKSPKWFARGTWKTTPPVAAFLFSKVTQL